MSKPFINSDGGAMAHIVIHKEYWPTSCAECPYAKGHATEDPYDGESNYHCYATPDKKMIAALLWHKEEIKGIPEWCPHKVVEENKCDTDGETEPVADEETSGEDNSETVKIIINTCYGGFGVSEDFFEAYGIPYSARYGIARPNVEMNLRTDHRLIEYIETYGSKAASGSYAELTIVELPKGTKYRINEYDGYESIETADDVLWDIAE